MTTIIEAKNIGKRYNITHQRGRYIALRDVIMNVLNSPLKFLKTKAKQAVGKNTKEEFWALKDVDFTISKGEVVGIIGHNGAGKSTLLKILTGITPPTEGEIKIEGRVSSLLEVGTGFHPELTGRENISLNGAILGMTRAKIAENFDKIVEFAGVEKFIDTPVKYYSSGMYVRLAFSVAAHMEPDILLVDEVLAVGDAEFQKKCLGKMEEVTSKSGRTILFVSHNLAAIQRLCKKCILLEKGKVKMHGNTREVIDAYLSKSGNTRSIYEFNKNSGTKEASMQKISILSKDGEATGRIPICEPFSIVLEYEINEPIKGAAVSTLFFSAGELLLSSDTYDKDGVLIDLTPGKYKTVVHVPAFLFNVGEYSFATNIHKPRISTYDYHDNLFFEIIDMNNPRSVLNGGEIQGKISSILNYDTHKIS